jgi:DNA polymerase III subunit epsilon
VSHVDGVVLGGGYLVRRAYWRRVDYASLDLETTGLDPDRDAIVSFGVVPIDQGRVRLDAASYRVVAPGVQMSSRSISVHGIRPADLVEAPPFSQVADELRSVLWRRVILAWAAWVESAFLSNALGGRAVAWQRHIVDVRRLAGLVDALKGRGRAGAMNETLAEMAERFGVPVDRTHHALWDAFVTAQLFLVLATRLEALGRGRLGALLRAGRPATPR